MFGPADELAGLPLALSLRWTGQELSQCMLIGVESKGAAQELLLEFLNSPEAAQALLLHCTVVALGR